MPEFSLSNNDTRSMFEAMPAKMKVLPARVSAAVAACLLAGCGPRLVAPPSGASSRATSAEAGLEGAIHALVNSHRGGFGKPAVRRHAGLDRLARQHSEFMRMNRGKFLGSTSDLSHYGFEERAMSARHHLGMSDVAENIGTCSGGFSNPAATLFGAWKRSSGHARNMTGLWSTTGIGVVVDRDGTVFATQIFAAENQSHGALMERMRQY